MELYEAMSTLRAVRRLKSDSIPEDVLNRVLEAATWAPTGGNVQPFRIICVSDPAKKVALRSWYHEEWHKYTYSNRKGLTKLPDEIRVKTEKMLDAGDYLAEHMHEAPVLMIFCFNPSTMAITDAGLNRPSVVGGASVYTAVENLMLACRVEGLGCVLTTLLCYKESEVKKLLNIPEDWGTCACVPVGYPVLGGHGPISRRSVDKIVYKDIWNGAFTTD